jgi:DNA sulfur modification protein DndB
MTEVIARSSDAVKVEVGGMAYCFGTISSDKIKALTFVPVIETSDMTYLNERPDEGYQRPGSPSRMRQFKKFLMEHPSSVIPPVLLSARNQWNFVPNEVGGKIGVLNIVGAAAIVDGQHRVGGYIALHEIEEEVREVPFILMLDLSLDQEREEFVVVNTSQKGVPRALSVFLEGSDEAMVAWELNEDPASPFFERITRTTMGKGHLFALQSVAKQIKELFKHGGLADLDNDRKVDFTERYFQIISDALQNEWADIEKLVDDGPGRRGFQFKLLELTGLVVWCTIGATIFHRSFSDEIGMNWENVSRLVREVSAIDWAKEGQYAGRTGLAGARVMVQDMERLLPAESGSSDTEE